MTIEGVGERISPGGGGGLDYITDLKEIKSKPTYKDKMILTKSKKKDRFTRKV